MVGTVTDGTTGRRCRLVRPTSDLEGRTASQLIPGVRQTHGGYGWAGSAPRVRLGNDRTLEEPTCLMESRLDRAGWTSAGAMDGRAGVETSMTHGAPGSAAARSSAGASCCAGHRDTATEHGRIEVTDGRRPTEDRQRSPGRRNKATEFGRRSTRPRNICNGAWSWDGVERTSRCRTKG